MSQNYRQLNDPRRAEQFFMSALMNLYYESGIKGIKKVFQLLPDEIQKALFHSPSPLSEGLPLEEREGVRQEGVVQ